MTMFLSNKDVNESINFNVGGQDIISLKGNGDIYVKGELVENNQEVVDGLKEFLKLARGDK
ncbi:hypothetical protein RCJ96_26900 [Bacillus sp. BSL6]|uniref:hypothetical protein n=1 Tax=Bacillus TaxID=1386 RepID=UPI0011527BFE|nr:hypothetical protein [Bacillus cereus group sp. Bcc02]MBL3820743.1 hypothetical protein [Bacillus cereus]MDA2034576.1 hypothetical protein [Bacillus cereus group sp. Bcc02]HDR7932342.1 hypothetical protein [Bacillus pacificus]